MEACARFAHTLSIAVKDAVLENNGFKANLTNYRAIVTYFHQSNPASMKLNALCTGEKSKFQEEVSTRWNSSYIMIQSLLTLKDAVDGAMKAMDKTDILMAVNKCTIFVGSAKML